MAAEKSFDVIVVGAGAYGASVAFHLIDSGHKVALVDRGPFVTQTSPRAAGLAVQVRTLLEFGQIATRSVELLSSFMERTGEPLQISQTGSLAVARDEASEKLRAADRAAKEKRLGLHANALTAPALSKSISGTTNGTERAFEGSVIRVWSGDQVSILTKDGKERRIQLSSTRGPK